MRLSVRNTTSNQNTKRGFTLIELLVVIAIIALLAAIIFPVFAQVRGKARSTTCQSNLRQIGIAIQMYSQDYDGMAPYAIDASDACVSQIWQTQPSCKTKIAQMSYLNPSKNNTLCQPLPSGQVTPGVLDPYVKSINVWKCAGDTGFDFLDRNYCGDQPCSMPSRPTMFDKHGASYLWRTEISFRQLNLDTISYQNAGPANINILFDGNGSWHGQPFSLGRSGLRYNTLFADGHVKFLTEEQLQNAWLIPVGPSIDIPCL
jgi:prepilin-type N-terminal cleavage/methylation domain-containing protein/prepilin-type processing-associated H-X9-DG protein